MMKFIINNQAKKISKILKIKQLFWRGSCRSFSLGFNKVLDCWFEKKGDSSIKFMMYIIKYHLQGLWVNKQYKKMIFFNGVQRIAFFSKHACSNNILDLSVSDVTQNLDSSKDLNEKNVINPEFDSYYKKMEETMSNIETDIELHQFIEKSIFEPFKKLLSEGKINKRLSASPVLYSYPMLLHKAMKIFREEFRDYVAVVSIFERIKSHGPESFVLGCSSDVYNEELLARWEGWGDLFEIENLLNEMKINSVTRTKETLKILEKIKLDIENMNFQKKLATDTFLSNNNTTCLMRLDTIYNEISEEISNNNEFS